MLTELADLQ
jgi:hypothetical protein